MNKITKNSLIIIEIFIFVLCLICAIVFVNSKRNRETNKELLYSTIYYFGLGSRSIRIYANGDVYDDLEIEDPNHEPDLRKTQHCTKSKFCAKRDRSKSKEPLSESSLNT